MPAKKNPLYVEYGFQVNYISFTVIIHNPTLESSCMGSKNTINEAIDQCLKYVAYYKGIKREIKRAFVYQFCPKCEGKGFTRGRKMQVNSCLTCGATGVVQDSVIDLPTKYIKADKEVFDS